MRVLITGGTSMIGRRTATTLAECGDDVVLFQRSAADQPHEQFQGSITDRDAVRNALEGVDAVIHLAATVAVTGRWSEFEQTNVHGTRVLLEEAASAGATRFVHVSTPSVAHVGSSIIGEGAGPADPDRTRGHYARSKALAEQLALGPNAGLDVVAIRPHLVWGPGDTQLVGRIVDRARSGRLALVGNGSALIDATYVDNAADALVAALRRAPQLAGRALVVSDGSPRTVSEMFNRICVAAGVAPPHRRVPLAVARSGGLIAERVWNALNRSDDPPMTSFLAEQLATAHWFDQRETRRLLDWRPLVSLDEGFERLAASFRPPGS